MQSRLHYAVEIMKWLGEGKSMEPDHWTSLSGLVLTLTVTSKLAECMEVTWNMARSRSTIHCMDWLGFLILFPALSWSLAGTEKHTN